MTTLLLVAAILTAVALLVTGVREERRERDRDEP